MAISLIFSLSCDIIQLDKSPKSRFEDIDVEKNCSKLPMKSLTSSDSTLNAN